MFQPFVICNPIRNSSSFMYISNSMKKATLLAVLAFVLFQISNASAADSTQTLTPTPVTADKTPPVSIGFHGGLNFNFPSASFPTPSEFGFPTFNSSSTGLGAAIGGMIDYPLSPSWGLGLRIAYNQLNGKLYGSFDSATVHVHDTISPSVPMLEISPIVKLPKLIPLENLYVLAGLDMGFALSPSYAKTGDSIVNGVTSSRSPITDAGVSSPSFRVALLAGLGYDIALSNTIHLQPEATIRFPFTKVSSDAHFDSWSIPQLRVGVNLMFDLASKNDTTPKPPEEPFVEPSIKRVVSYNDKGDTMDVNKLRVEDIQYSELYPLVPYVFFNQNGTKTDTALVVPKKRESGEASDFTTLNDAIKVNQDILDLLCTRMKKYPSARLTITGTNDGKGEVKNKELSRQRAEMVKQYLVDCGVESERLEVQARDLPEKASSSTVPDGQAENRRVEFHSDMPDLLSPVVSKQDIERLADPDVIEFIPANKSSDPITSWKLELTQAGRTLRSLSGIGETSAIRWSIRPSELSDKQVPIDYSYTVENSRGASKTFNGSLPVDYISSLKKKQEKLADRTVDKFSLILFDFDKDVITPDNQRILDQKVIPAIKYNSTVKIYGHTDRIGDDKYNRELSLRRARATMAALQAKMKDVKYEVYGYGELNAPYDNDPALGRQLNRTVQIVVETPR